MICPELMYKQHTHMVYGELHILPYLVLDQNANYNTCPAPLCHEVWNVDLHATETSDNMASLVESGKYGAINTTDKSTNIFYVIMFTSGAYTLQENTTIDRQIITAGEVVVKAKYLCSMQIDTNWYWNQQQKHHVITVPTRTILHPQL